MKSCPSVSVIIPNYNYERYVGAAIDSALNLDWPDVEVIVIDDGSTDGSRDVIASYGDRIRTILQPNSGQLVGCNKGFALARGDIVIFLDSDDLLHPSIVREMVAVWTPATSKVQVQMQVIDANGTPTGAYFPQFHLVPTPRQVREWSTTTAAYPTPPGSANAYPRSFLDKIFPLVETAGKANDSYCLAAAPLLGDVVTVAKPLVSYRVHDRNQGALSKLDLHQFERQMTRARQRHAYALGIAKRAGVPMAENALDRHLGYLGYRLASLKLAPDRHPIEGDSGLRVLADFARAAFAPQGVSRAGRAAMFAWAFVSALLPAPLARRPILWRFAPTTRPQFLRSMLTRLRIVRGARGAGGPAKTAG